MQNKAILSDPLQRYLSDSMRESEFANLVTTEIREGSFCQALKWVYPMAVSYLKRRPDDLRWESQEKVFDYTYKNVMRQRARFSEWQPEPTVRSIDIAAQSIEPPHNIPAVKLSKLILHETYEGRWSQNIILEMAREHLADVNGWEVDPIKKMIPSEDFWISKNIRGKVGANLVREILGSARPGRYAKALSLIMPLADHIISCLEKDKHVLGRQGFTKNGFPMIEVRYFPDAEQFSPWKNLRKTNKNDANAILIALSSLNIASGFDSKPLKENLIRNPVAGIRIYLALNMLACLIPQDKRNDVCGFKGYACSDFMKATGSYLRCHGHLPEPVKPRAPFSFSKRTAPTSKV